MTSFEAGLKRLQTFAKKWGGDIRYEEDLEQYSRAHYAFHRSSEFSPAPFITHLGVRWRKKTILYSKPEKGYTDEFLGGIIHEMGHVFACLKVPDQADEYDFLGWEWTLAQRAKLVPEWLAGMKDYQIGDEELDIYHTPFAELSKKNRGRVLEHRISVAKKKGLLSSRGALRTVR